MDGVRSIAVGVWVRTGSRYEIRPENGIAHFLEHMMFKGTKKRSPLKIAQSLESLGGSLNAYTSKEITCFYSSALDAHLRQSVEVLADMVCNSVFPEKEIQREQFVVLEEIKAIKDTPEELIFDIFYEKLFPESAIGRPILGREESVNEFQRASIIGFWQRFYTPGNIVVAASGNLDHNKFLKLVGKYFNFDTGIVPPLPEPAIFDQNKTFVFDQPITQAHLCIGGKAINYTSEDRVALLVLNAYLGGGMSSRLFQNLREKRGLAYSVYSFAEFYSDIGIFGVYLGTDPAKLKMSVDVIYRELDNLRTNILSAGKLTKIKDQMKGNLVLGLESTSRRMSRIAKNQMYFGEFIPIDTLIDQIDRVCADDVLRLANQILNPDNFITVILQPKQ
jgi:predicted Zn-dependent peptidase